MPKYKIRIKEYQLIVQAKLAANEQINERELDFFCRKYIRGFLKAKYVKKFMFTGLEYTGPIGISLYDRLSKPITRFDFFFIMEQIVDIVQKVKANSLPLNKIAWDLSSVYINETTRELQFIYLPLENINTEADIIGFIEKIIYTAKPAADQNTDYITEFTYFIRGMRTFDPEKTENFIKKKEPGIVNTIKKHSAGNSGFMTDKQKDYYAHYENEDEATGLLEEDEATGLLNEDEATGLLIEDDQETGLLDETSLLSEETVDQYNRHFPTLRRASTGEMIQINKPVFRLGREASEVDYHISDNGNVSRKHADIITRGCDFYVKDLKSKNGTFINGSLLEAQQETQIQDGDELRISDEEFVFYL